MNVCSSSVRWKVQQVAKALTVAVYPFLAFQQSQVCALLVSLSHPCATNNPHTRARALRRQKWQTRDAKTDEQRVCVAHRPTTRTNFPRRRSARNEVTMLEKKRIESRASSGLVPNLIFAIETFEHALIKLSTQSKVRQPPSPSLLLRATRTGGLPTGADDALPTTRHCARLQTRRSEGACLWNSSWWSRRKNSSKDTQKQLERASE